MDDYSYKMICVGSSKKLNEEVNKLAKEGYRPMGPHTHQKSNYQDVAEASQWYNVFCISMEKKGKTKTDE